MARQCTICAHPQRVAIDRELIGGDAIAAIAAKYSASPDALSRHAAGHVVALLAKGEGAADLADADTLIDDVRALEARALAILDTAEAADNFRSALGAIREARELLALRAKLQGAIDDRPQINLLIAPEWLVVRAAVLEALRPYPEAGRAVASRLVALEGR